MTLLAAFQALLARYTGQEDLAVGTPIANRNRAETEGLIGFFVNTLRAAGAGLAAIRPSASCWPGAPTALAAYAHQDLPFERLVEELRPERYLAQTPLVQVLFQLWDVREGVLRLQGLDTALAGCRAPAASRFDLSLGWRTRRGSSRLSASYSADLFDDRRWSGCLGHYQTLLDAVLERPRESRPAALRAAAPDRGRAPADARRLEPHRRSRRRGAGPRADRGSRWRARPRPPPCSWMEWVRSHLPRARTSGRTGWARTCSGSGSGPKRGSASRSSARPSWSSPCSAMLKAGAAYVPLDPGYPPERQRWILEDSGVSVLLTHRGWSGIAEIPSGLRTVLLDEVLEEVLAHSAADLPLAVDADSLAYVLYTSGSTGRPKGVPGAAPGGRPTT